MASPALIGLSLLAGGAAAYALYKEWQAKNESTLEKFCSGLCAGNTECMALCSTIGSVLQAVNPFTNSEHSWEAQVKNDLASNDKLNGAVAIPLATGQTVAVAAGYDGGNVMIGSANAPTGDYAGGGQGALAYKNGCVPFAGAPGFASCAPGTVSMWASDVQQRAGTDYAGIPSPSDFNTPARSELPLDASLYYGASGGEKFYDGKASSLMTGEGGDAATAGPFGPVGSGETFGVPEGFVLGDGIAYEFGQTAAEAAAGSTWISRGVRITCAAGQVPKSIYNSVVGVANTDALGTESCINPNDPLLRCDGTQAPPGLTWDSELLDWTELQSGETVNNGPCDPSYSASGPLGDTLQGSTGSSSSTGASSSTASSSTATSSSSAVIGTGPGKKPRPSSTAATARVASAPASSGATFSAPTVSLLTATSPE